MSQEIQAPLDIRKGKETNPPLEARKKADTDFNL